MEEGKEIIEIYKGNPVNAEIIKDILNDNEVIASMSNQLMGSIAPFYVSGGGIDPVGVEIFARDKEKALALIEAFNKSNSEE